MGFAPRRRLVRDDAELRTRQGLEPCRSRRKERTPELVSKIFAFAAKKDGLYTAGWDGVHSDNWIYTQVGSSWF